MADPEKVTSLVNVRISSGTQASHVIVDTEENTQGLRKELERLQQQGRIYGHFVYKVEKETTVEEYMKWVRSQGLI